MVNRIKNMVGMVMVLVLVMGMSSNTFAEVDIWKDYKEKLKKGITNQEKFIVIDLKDNMEFFTTDIIQEGITNAYKETIKEIPEILGNMNIENVKIYTDINPKTNGLYWLKQVKYEIDYINNTSEINKYLEKKIYNDIKSLPTAYEKIEKTYDYILEIE